MIEIEEYYDGEYNIVYFRQDGKELWIWWSELHELKKKIDEILTHT